MNIDFTFSSHQGPCQFETEAAFDTDCIRDRDLKSIYIDRFGGILANESSWELADELKERDEWPVTLDDCSDSELEDEMELRGFKMDEDIKIDSINLANKINQGKATLDDMYRFIENASGVLICK
jgi:hypothetical protein